MTGLPVGAEAPDFGLRDQRGRTVRLSALRERGRVLVVFYPYAFSNVCTGELEVLRDWPPVRGGEIQVVAVSCDAMFTLRAFAESKRLDYPLLSDFWPHGAVASAYGVFDEELGCAQRSTYLVDEGGTVTWSVHNPMGEARHLEGYAGAVRRIG